MIALPPASELDANTFASDQRQFCVPSPMPCFPEVDFTKAETIHSSVKYPPLKPNGLTIGSRSKPQLVFAIVIAFAGASSAAAANTPFGATAAAIPESMKPRLSIFAPFLCVSVPAISHHL